MAQPPAQTTSEQKKISPNASPPLGPQGAQASRHHGRGGAGNFNSKSNSPPLTNADLATPTIKSTTYTTGRGGSGNMAKNLDPSEARAAQDVDAPQHHSKDMNGTYHWGRGGEGNMTVVGKSEKEQAKELREQRAKKERTGSFKDAVKEKLGLKRPNVERGTSEGKDESAVE